MGFFLRLSKPIALCALAILVGWLALAHWLSQQHGLAAAALATLVGAAATQWIASTRRRHWRAGLAAEDLLLGPAWLLDRALNKLNGSR